MKEQEEEEETVEVEDHGKTIVPIKLPPPAIGWSNHIIPLLVSSDISA